MTQSTGRLKRVAKTDERDILPVNRGHPKIGSPALRPRYHTFTEYDGDITFAGPGVLVPQLVHVAPSNRTGFRALPGHMFFRLDGYCGVNMHALFSGEISHLGELPENFNHPIRFPTNRIYLCIVVCPLLSIQCLIHVCIYSGRVTTFGRRSFIWKRTN